MTIPNYTQPSFSSNDGEWNLQQQQLIIELQRVLGQQKIELPKVDSATVALLNTSENIGTILFNTTTGKGMINEAGTYKTITTS